MFYWLKQAIYSCLIKGSKKRQFTRHQWLMPIILATQEDCGLKQAGANSSWDPIWKIPNTTRAGGVTQGVGSEFKLQYCKEKKRQFNIFGGPYLPTLVGLSHLISQSYKVGTNFFPFLLWESWTVEMLSNIVLKRIGHRHTNGGSQLNSENMVWTLSYPTCVTTWGIWTIFCIVAKYYKCLKGRLLDLCVKK
jgi:hypothetical protein